MLSRSDLLTLLTINFIVVTKGAERISEVSARFTLDAMPGKQMAIDADLNAGLINQAQAQTRRKDVASEADFYGAMDGASKFVRGDAIAGMMILAINLIGGVCIGIFKYNLSADAAFQQYVLMTIATVLVASSTVTKDHILLAADVRLALRRSITHPFVRKQELTVYTLNNELENLLTNVVNQAQQGGKVMLDSVPVDPNMLNQFQSTMPQVKEQMKAAGKDPVLLVPPQLRPLLARYARLFAPGLHVLSYNEVPDELELKIMGALM